jgi:hypothetical protein
MLNLALFSVYSTFLTIAVFQSVDRHTVTQQWIAHNIPPQRGVDPARKTIPTTIPDLTTEQLKDVTNKGREEVAARVMVEQGSLSLSRISQSHAIPN